MTIQRPTDGDPLPTGPGGWSGQRETIDPGECRGQLIGMSPRMAELRALVSKISCVDSAVLLSGESGSGKRTVAEAIHFGSPRSRGPLVIYPCNSGGPEETERELFEERLPCAAGGTLVLEEVETLPPQAQVRLLYHLQERARPGVRVIGTTLEPLANRVATGAFRRDLYFMLHVVPLEVPPLRERLSDLPLLVEQWSQRFAQRNGAHPAGFSAGAIEVLRRYSWPGNLRELESALERAVVLAGNGRQLEASAFAFLEEPRTPIGPEPLKGKESEESTEPLITLDELERRHVLRALEFTRQNRTRAASMLNISVRTLRNKLHHYRHMGLLGPGEADIPRSTGIESIKSV